MVKFVPRPLNDDWTSAILENISDDTALVSVPNCHWTDGGIINLQELSNYLKNKDIAFAIDGTQSVGAMPIDIEKIKPDFMVVSGYKWCLGPYSLGLAYIDKKYHNGLPLEQNWMSKFPMPIDNSVPDMTVYNDYNFENARKFDFGQLSKIFFSKGPGSFTSIRAIKSLSQGISLSQGCKLEATDNFEIFLN